MNKKSIGALLLSAALLVGGTASTFAYFTNSATTDVVKFTTGNVKVAFLPEKESNWSLVCSPGRDNDEIDTTTKAWVKKVAPGDLIKKTFVLKNTGSLDAKVRLSLTDITPAGTPDGSGVDNFGTFCRPDWEAWKAYTIDADGKPGKEVKLTVYNDVNHVWAGYAELDASATSNQTLVVEACVKVNELMPNGNNFNNFDKDFGFKVKAEATQWNNPGWTEDGK